MKPRDRFEAMMAQADQVESQIRAGLGIFDEAIAMSRQLPFPFRPIMVWIGKAKRRKGEAQLLRLETARAMLIGREVQLRRLPAEPGPWER